MMASVVRKVNVLQNMTLMLQDPSVYTSRMFRKQGVWLSAYHTLHRIISEVGVYVGQWTW
jgi:hypothetical protein